MVASDRPVPQQLVRVQASHDGSALAAAGAGDDADWNSPLSCWGCGGLADRKPGAAEPAGHAKAALLPACDHQLQRSALSVIDSDGSFAAQHFSSLQNGRVLQQEPACGTGAAGTAELAASPGPDLAALLLLPVAAPKGDSAGDDAGAEVPAALQRYWYRAATAGHVMGWCVSQSTSLVLHLTHQLADHILWLPAVRCGMPVRRPAQLKKVPEDGGCAGGAATHAEAAEEAAGGWAAAGAAAAPAASGSVTWTTLLRHLEWC